MTDPHSPDATILRPASPGPSDPVRVVALDLDGTIVEPDLTIGEDVRRLLATLTARGVRCVTATGRPLPFQLDLFERCGLAGDRSPFSALIADERELYLAGDGRYAPDEEWNSRIRARWQTRMGGAVAWVEEARQQAQRWGYDARVDSVTEVTERGMATIRLASDEAAEAVCEWLQARVPHDGSDLACNRNTTIVQVYDAAAGKAALLTRLAAHWGLDHSQILAIGDSTNDLGMLDGSHGFRSATVANAAPSVRAAVTDAGGFVARGRVGAGVVEAVTALVHEASTAAYE